MFNTYDWEQLRNGLSNLTTPTGTEFNPAYLTDISPAKISLHNSMIESQLPTNQEYFEKTLTAPDEGGQWDWTSQGVQLIKPAKLGKKSNAPISERLHRLLSELKKQKADIVYLPIGNRPLAIAGRNSEFAFSKEYMKNVVIDKPDRVESWCSFSVQDSQQSKQSGE